MAICPHCQREGKKPYRPCPGGDGYFLIEEEAYRDHRDDPWLGRQLGERFVVSAMLGRGSMSRVYRAYQRQVDRTVALKLFEREDVTTDSGPGPDDRDRFVREARVLAKLSHPNCVTLYDFGYAGNDQFLYIAMEHVAGISLRRAIRRGVKFDALAEINRQVLMALREAHALDIVHRDLKPENIVLSHRQTSDEQIVKVLDFGIAKLLGKQTNTEKTRAGQLFGTPAYMSPEQCRGETDVSPASDIYSLGCIAYELVTGRLPFEAEVPRELIRQHQFEPVPEMQIRPGIDIPDGLEKFIRVCLSKEPEDRYGDAAQALGAFEEVAGGADRSAPLERGLDKLGAASGEVHVPESNVSGVQLDPTGEREELDFEATGVDTVGADGGDPGPSARIEAPENEAAETGATETMPGADDQADSTGRKGRGWSSGRIGLAVAAAVVVAVFLILLAALINVMLTG